MFSQVLTSVHCLLSSLPSSRRHVQSTCCTCFVRQRRCVLLVVCQFVGLSDIGDDDYSKVVDELEMNFLKFQERYRRRWDEKQTLWLHDVVFAMCNLWNIALFWCWFARGQHCNADEVDDEPDFSIVCVKPCQFFNVALWNTAWRRCELSVAVLSCYSAKPLIQSVSVSMITHDHDHGRLTNTADSAFHPFGVDKWVVGCN